MTKSPKTNSYPPLADDPAIAPIEWLPRITLVLSEFMAKAEKWITRKPRGAKDVYATYVALRRLWDVTDALNKMVDKACRAIEADYLVPKFEELGQSSTTLPEMNVRLQVRYDLYTTIRATTPDGQKLGDEDKRTLKLQAFDWLKKNKMGALIQPAVHPQSLAADMREWITENNKQPPEALFSVFNKPIVSMHKLGGKDK